MPRRNTGYASLGGKLNLLRSLFFPPFFAMCVANHFSAEVDFLKDQPKLI